MSEGSKLMWSEIKYLSTLVCIFILGRVVNLVVWRWTGELGAPEWLRITVAVVVTLAVLSSLVIPVRRRVAHR